MRRGLLAGSLLALLSAAAPTAQNPAVVVGTQIDVKLQTGLNSGVAKLDQRFEAISIQDVRVGSDVAIPAGSVVRGFVSSVRASTRLQRKGTLTLSFDEILRRGAATTLRASVVQAIDGRAAAPGPAARILASGNAALVGVIVASDGTIASTEAANVDLPVGTILRIRIDTPLAAVR